MASISLQNVDLDFTVRRSHVSLKEFFVRRFQGKPLVKPRVVQALADVNLDVRNGQRIGIVGHNGAGKSTLLRLLAGVYVPSRGDVGIEGRVSSLLDIGLGVEPDATGWDNMFYRGYLQRQTPDELRRLSGEIAEFSELGDFLDLPVRCYSSGMIVRLMFSIATAIEPEILLVDEVFGAGDIAFQEKAIRRMFEMVERARIMVMASHDLNLVRQLCDTVVWMDHGRVRMQGSPDVVTKAYEDFMHKLSEAA
ncbi:MAG: ABC transporter ATP-binding protein [Pirellulales bacterium]